MPKRVRREPNRSAASLERRRLRQAAYYRERVAADPLYSSRKYFREARAQPVGRFLAEARGTSVLDGGPRNLAGLYSALRVRERRTRVRVFHASLYENSRLAYEAWFESLDSPEGCE